MSIAIVTGSAGLVGSESVRYFAARGLDVIGIDNGMRAVFFGPEASTAWMSKRLQEEVPSYLHCDVDIRNQDEIFRLFSRYGSDIALVIHAAAQPSHDWAAREPFVDFTVNANGTLTMLEATRKFAPNAVFIFMSTNKVYGDLPNQLPLVEEKTRWNVALGHPYRAGIPEAMSIDGSMHSLFGASKIAADVLVQEYGRYFGLRTVAFRGGCLTGPNHSGTQLHGFLAYLVKCAMTGKPYSIFGYKGKQVRDNIHSADLVNAFAAFFQRPRSAEVYNMGGGCYSNCSILEAIQLCEETTGMELATTYVDENRKGDHIWYVSDLTHFESHFPDWRPNYDVRAIISEIYELNRERWKCQRPTSTTYSASSSMPLITQP